MDAGISNFSPVESLVERTPFIVSAANCDDLSNFEDTSYSVHHGQYCTLLGLVEMGDCKQVPNNGPNILRDSFLDHLVDKLFRNCKRLGYCKILCAKRGGNTCDDCTWSCLSALQCFLCDYRTIHYEFCCKSNDYRNL